MMHKSRKTGRCETMQRNLLSEVGLEGKRSVERDDSTHPAANTEVGIYKGKQESRKTRKQELDRESDQESFFFVSWSFSCFLDRFLGRSLVFFFS